VLRLIFGMKIAVQASSAALPMPPLALCRKTDRPEPVQADGKDEGLESVDEEGSLDEDEVGLGKEKGGHKARLLLHSRDPSWGLRLNSKQKSDRGCVGGVRCALTPSVAGRCCPWLAVRPYVIFQQECSLGGPYTLTYTLFGRRVLPLACGAP